MNIGKESEQIEFKRTTGEMKEAMVSISSILNKNKMGTLYFGVKNNGDVVGQDVGEATQRDISQAIRRMILPECYFDISVRQSDEGLSFIEVNFSGEDAPYSADGRYYMRFSDEDRKMTDKELEAMFLHRVKDYSAWEDAQSFDTTNDVDDNLVRKSITDGYENNRIPYPFDDIATALKRFGLLAEDNEHLNNAGRVLFSKNKPVWVKLSHFASETKKLYISLEHFHGNVFECISQAYHYVLNAITWRITIDGSLKRTETPEIPLKALREIITNAFCHAKYDSNTTFEISVYKDRVEIYSPGFFPRGFTPEDFAYGHEQPIMLNPKIVNVLYRSNQIESIGYGFERTFAECKQAGVKFQSANTQSGFLFTFYRPLYESTNKDILTKTDKNVMQVIAQDGNLSNTEIASRINRSVKTVYRALKKLKELGYIIESSDGKTVVR